MRKRLFLSAPGPVSGLPVPSNFFVWIGILLFLCVRVHTVMAQCPITVQAGNDKYVCQPMTPVQLNGSISGSYLSYEWMPTQGLAPATSLTPTATVAVTTTYTLKGRAVSGTNLVSNGDFEQGNVGFTSGYLYSPGNLVPEGTYDILANPRSSHPNFQPCASHPAGGQMMVVNGAGVPGTDVWCYTVAVTPNTDYVFSIWATSVLSTSPAILQFSINSTLLGPPFGLPGAACAWSRFYAQWNSGTSTSATICVVNQNTTLSGNDFALDDILFSEVCTETDEVTVNVVNLNAVATTAVMPCANASVTLSGAGSSEGNNISHAWTTVGGNIVSGANTLYPVVNKPGNYTLTVTYNDGNVRCTKTASVLVTVSPVQPVANIPTPVEITCLLKEVQMDVFTNLPPPYTYRWATTNGRIQGSTTDPQCIAIAAGQYTVTVINDGGCTATAQTTVVANNAPPAARATGSLLSCQNPTALLSGAGSATGARYSYVWTTVNGAFAAPANTLNTSASKAGTYTLLVRNGDNGCTATATTTVTSNFTPSVVNIVPGGNLNCQRTTVTLGTTATPPASTFQWFSTSGGNIVSGQNTGTVSINTAGTYSVVSTHPVSGCKDTAQIAVTANTTRPVAQIAPPDTLTCARTRLTLVANGAAPNIRYTYQWTAGSGGHIVAGDTTLRLTVDSVGRYTLVVTDTTNRCMSTTGVSVLKDTLTVRVSARNKDTLTCARLTALAIAQHNPVPSGVSYLWTNAVGATVGTRDTLLIQTPGLYQLTLRNNRNGCTSTATVQVQEDKSPPQFVVVPPAVLNCAVKDMQLAVQTTPSGQTFGYQWFHANGGIVSGATTANPTVNAAGSYQVTVTQIANACTATATVAVAKNDTLPVAMVAPPPVLTCLVHQISLDGSASSVGMNYSWSSADGRLVGSTNGAAATADQRGTYQLLVRNPRNFCTATATVLVQENKTPPIAEAGASDTLDCRVPKTTLQGVATTSGAATYLWTGPVPINGPQTLTPTVETAGAYILSVTDGANGCSARDTVWIFDNGKSPTLSVAAPDTITCLRTSVQLNAHATGQGTSLQTSWTTTNGQIVSGENTTQATVSRQGLYQIRVLDPVNGCSTHQTLEVKENKTPPAITIAPPALLNCAVHSLDLSVASATSGQTLQYQWSTSGGTLLSGATTDRPKVGREGQYQVLATNPHNGCTTTESVQVNKDTLAPVAVIKQPAVLTCVVEQVPIDATQSSVGPAVRYDWSTANGHFTSGQATAAPLINQAGIYVLTLINTQNQCTATASVEVSENKTPPTVKVSTPDTLDCRTTAVTLQVQATTFGAATYAWSGPGLRSGQQTATPIVIKEGTYVLHVTDQFNGCSARDTVWIFDNGKSPTLSVAAPDTITCLRTSVQLNAHATGQGTSLQTSWTTTNGQIVSGENTTQATVSRQGLYQIQILDPTNGCSTNQTLEVKENKTPPAIAIAPPALLNCAVRSLDLSVAPVTSGQMLQYQWNTSGGILLSGAATDRPKVGREGQYQVLATNPHNGCTTTEIVQVKKDTLAPVAVIKQPAVLTCVVEQVPIDATQSSVGPAVRYDWSTANGHFTSGQATAVPLIDQAGIYVLTLTNIQNQCTATASVEVSENKTPPTVKVSAADTLDCRNAAVTLRGQATTFGAATYAWSGPGLSSGQQTATPIVIQEGTYVLHVTDQFNGCSARDSVVVVDNAQLPVLSVSKPDTLTCTVETVVIQGEANKPGAVLQTQWTTTNGLIVSGQATGQATVARPGQYLFRAFDPQSGCASTRNVEVFENKIVPTLVLAQPDTITCARTSVVVSATSVGHSPVLQVFWQTDNGRFVSGQNSFQAVVDRPGKYRLRVVDPKNGCQTESEVAVVQNAAFPLADAGPARTLTCAQPELVLEGQAEAGNAIQILWTTANGRIAGGANTPQPKIDAPGLYILSVSNRNSGCTSTSSVVVQEDKTKPLVEAGAGDTLKCSLPFLRLVATASGPATALEYHWTTANGHFTNDPLQLQPTVDAPGIYLLTVRNRVNGCTSTAQTEIFNDARAPLSNAGQAAALTCVRRQVALQGTASAGTGISYHWQTTNGQILSGASTLQPTVTAAGTYELLVSDANNGCKSLSTVRVEEDTLAPVAHAGTTQTLTCARTEVTLQGEARTPAHPGVALQVAWSSANGNLVSGGTSLAPTVNRSGLYVLRVENPQNGCVSAASVAVGIDTLAPSLSTAAPAVLTCAISQVQLSAAVAQPAQGNFTAQWTAGTGGGLVSGGNGLSPLVDRAGPYRLTVRSTLNGCSSDILVQVQEDKMPPVARAGSAVVLTCASPTRALDGSASSQGSAYVYTWSGGQILTGGNTLTPVAGATGTYVLLVRDVGNGCTAVSTVSVTEDKQAPQAQILAPALLTCIRDSVVLNAAGSTGGSVLKASWTSAHGGIRRGANTLTPVVDQAGLYVLTLENAQNGCTTTATVRVQADKVPPGAQVASAPPLSCMASSTVLAGYSPAARPVAYLWSALSGNGLLSPPTQAHATVNQTGIYQLRVTDPANGCTSVATGSVTRLQGPHFQIAGKQPDCHAPTGYVALSALKGDAPPFQYALNGAAPQSTPEFKNLKPGLYEVVMRDAIGCTFSQGIQIRTPSVPTVQLPKIDPLNFGDAVELVPVTNLPKSSIAQWVWSPDEGLSCSNCPRPTAMPLEDTRYTLTMTDLNGCTAQASVLLEVSRERHVWAPNVFSPNGDGRNDFFTLYGKGVDRVSNLRIFDRWGNQVFLVKEIPVNEDAAGWDGTFQGQVLTPAVFVWVAEVVFLDGERKLLSGDVAILK